MLEQISEAASVVVLLGFTLTVVLTAMYFRHRAREMRHQTIRMALEKGQPLPAELLQEGRGSRRQSDLSRGVKLLFAGIGLSGFLYLSHRQIWALGVVLIALGLGHLASHWLTGDRGDGTRRPSA